MTQSKEIKEGKKITREMEELFDNRKIMTEDEFIDKLTELRIKARTNNGKLYWRWLYGEK